MAPKCLQAVFSLEIEGGVLQNARILGSMGKLLTRSTRAWKSHGEDTPGGGGVAEKVAGEPTIEGPLSEQQTGYTPSSDIEEGRHTLQADKGRLRSHYWPFDQDRMDDDVNPSEAPHRCRRYSALSQHQPVGNQHVRIECSFEVTMIHSPCTGSPH
jgi:hypothetical protein